MQPSGHGAAWGLSLSQRVAALSLCPQSKGTKELPREHRDSARTEGQRHEGRSGGPSLPTPPTPAVGVNKRGPRGAMQEGFQEGWALSDVGTEGCAGLGWKGRRGWQVCWSYTPALPLDQQKHFVVRLHKMKRK